MSIEIYHGDNYLTRKLNPKLMNNGNNEIGVGISFGSIETAKHYGKDIVKAIIEPSNFIPARDLIEDHLSKETVVSILLHIYKENKEFVYYELTDWGFPIESPEEIEEFDLISLADCYKTEEIRDFQTHMAENFGVELFVEAWNKYVEKDGTYLKRTEDEIWYAIINNQINLEKIA